MNRKFLIAIDRRGPTAMLDERKQPKLEKDARMVAGFIRLDRSAALDRGCFEVDFPVTRQERIAENDSERRNAPQHPYDCERHAELSPLMWNVRIAHFALRAHDLAILRQLEFEPNNGSGLGLQTILLFLGD